MAAYEEGFGRLTAQAIIPLLDAVRCSKKTESFIDVATGLGHLARAARHRGAGHVVGLDFAPSMLQRARAIEPASAAVEWVEGDATALPAGDGTVDAVTNAFGVLHLEEPSAFFAEVARVLRPGGRLAFAVWAPPPATEAFRIVSEALERHGRPTSLPEGPPFFQYADPAVCRQALEAVGLDEVATFHHSMFLDLKRAEDVWLMMRHGTARTRAALSAQPAECAHKIRAAIVDAATDDDGRCRRLAMPCVITTARKPLQTSS